MGDFALSICFYAEIANMGPGAVLNERVTWHGIKKDHSGPFLGGDAWSMDQAHWDSLVLCIKDKVDLPHY
ncbi:putative pectinesterase/pectinesterase inhibitor 28 [Morella rubra]|uniref:Putative pectinesterase/pectinesterase inhibitor 28 n=1 Tax=Morella rubra TaxID=262757 RepID=A0A6A1W3D1_9ROSI|nr:putative pectinesterase/pectinesterase inhibitor 28 [Morella rubra]